MAVGSGVPSFPFAAFARALEDRYGPTAAMVRHELFFQAHKPFPTLRAVAAAVRDWTLLRRSYVQEQLSFDRPIALLLATLGGGNGWGTLERTVPAIRQAGLTPVILAHPRLARSVFPADLPVIVPQGVTGGGMPPRAPLGLASALLRHQLWQAALGAVIQAVPASARGVILLHNDFDMMSAASIGLGWPTICLQHGIPTDEFFPCRADYQVVWGASSQQAFAAAGVPAEAMIFDALGRAERAMQPLEQPPQGVAVVSQSHAAIFGPQLPQALTAVVADLCRLVPETTVLLHPAEQGKHPYGAVSISLPPHRLLRDHPQPSLVVAYCSTMALDAAAAGHWVVTLDFPYPDNQAARLVASAPLRAQTAQDVARIYQRLCHDSAFRSQTAKHQRAWLESTFSTQTGGLSRLLQAVVLPCRSSPALP